jgi:serine/threonine protein kinase
MKQPLVLLRIAVAIAWAIGVAQSSQTPPPPSLSASGSSSSGSNEPIVINAWIRSTYSLPTARSYSSVVFFNGSFVVFGGCLDYECRNFSTNVDRYNPSSQEIHKASDIPVFLPIPSKSPKLPPTFIRAGFAGTDALVSVVTESLLGVIKTQLWVVGACSYYFARQGNQSVAQVEERYRGVWGLSQTLDSVEFFSPIPPKTRLRANASCQAVGSRIYIIGGVYLDTLEPSTMVDAVDVALLEYIPDVFRHVEPVMNAAVTIDSSMMYVAGGVTSSCGNSTGITQLCNSLRVTAYLFPADFLLNQSVPLVPIAFPNIAPYDEAVGRHLLRVFSFGGRLTVTAGPRLVQEYLSSPTGHDIGTWFVSYASGNPVADSTVFAFPLPDLFLGVTLTYYTFGGIDQLSLLPTADVFMRFGSDSIPRVISPLSDAPVFTQLNFTLQPSPKVGFVRLSNNFVCYGNIMGVSDEKLHTMGDRSVASFFPLVLSPVVYVCFSHGSVFITAVNTSVNFYTTMTALSPFALVPNVPTDTPGPHAPSTDEVVKFSLIGAVSGVVLIAVAVVTFLWLRRRNRMYQELRERLNSDGQSLGIPDANDSLVRNTTSDSRYKVGRRIGEGAFSSVYLVRRKTDNAEFAMKFMICGDDRERLEAIKECETINSLQGHPNVIQLIDMFMNYEFSHTSRDSGLSENDTSLLISNSMRAVFKQTSKLDRKVSPAESPGQLQYGATAALTAFPKGPVSSKDQQEISVPNVHTRYLCLVMEYHICGDLSRYVLKQSRLNSSFSHSSGDDAAVSHAIPEYQLLSVAFQISSVLHHLHSQRPPIVHRDLKPENVLIRGAVAPTVDDPVIPVVVTDFGLAFIQEEHRKSGKGGGTRPYISPESWRGQTTTASDIWSFGCVMYAIATERLTADNVRIMFMDARSANFSQTIQNDLVGCHYSPKYAAFVASLLEVDPKKRPTAERLMKLFKASAADGRVVFDETVLLSGNP